jgi:hypothetical protein
MFAELVCLETTPAKWHGGASIFRGLAYFRGEPGRVQTGCILGYFIATMPFEANNDARGPAFQLG